MFCKFIQQEVLGNVKNGDTQTRTGTARPFEGVVVRLLATLVKLEAISTSVHTLFDFDF